MKIVKASSNKIINMSSAKNELEMGVKVEKEHKDIYDDLKKKFGEKFPWTLDEFYKKIAMAHLDEFKDYYTKLKKMEEEANKNMKNTASGKQTIKLSRQQWENIGQKAGWMKTAQFGNGMETVEIGSTPNDEPCAQVGSDNYRQLAQMEIKAFAKQCERMFPNKPQGARFVVTNNPHDFGTYYELGVKFRTDDEESENYAYEVQNGMPSNWDDQARAELEQQGYFQQLNANRKKDDYEIPGFEGTNDALNNLGIRGR